MNSISKKCSKCGKIKPVGDFRYRTDKPKYLNSWCNKCLSNNANKWNNSHLKKVKQHQKTWHNDHPEYRSKYRSMNIDKVNGNAKNWRENHQKELPQINRRYYLSHKEKCLLNRQNRRAREKSAPGTITQKQWEDIKKKYGYKCLVPGCDETKITLDHVVPLKLGGTHTIDNVQPLCKHHNSSKGARVIDYREFARLNDIGEET